MTSRTDQMLGHFGHSRARLSAALTRVRDELFMMQLGCDFVHTGPNRFRYRELLDDEAALSGALQRMVEGRLPDQLEFTFT